MGITKRKWCKRFHWCMGIIKRKLRWKNGSHTAGIRTGWAEPCRKVWRRYCKDNRQPWTIRRKKAVNLINSYGDDALEMSKEGKNFDEVKKIVEGGLSETA